MVRHASLFSQLIELSLIHHQRSVMTESIAEIAVSRSIQGESKSAATPLPLRIWVN